MGGRGAAGGGGEQREWGACGSRKGQEWGATGRVAQSSVSVTVCDQEEAGMWVAWCKGLWCRAARVRTCGARATKGGPEGLGSGQRVWTYAAAHWYPRLQTWALFG